MIEGITNKVGVVPDSRIQVYYINRFPRPIIARLS
jgi:hypothetical protein